MALAVDSIPFTVAPCSLIKDRGVHAYAATEPADTDEAAQCLVSMSSSSSSANVGRDSGTRQTTVGTLTDPTAPPSSRVPHSKPDRLSLACNTCRKRKVRCDAHQPKCHNCIRRGDVCVTSDPRKPGAPVAVRQKAARRHTGPPSVQKDRLFAREVEQQQHRHSLLQARRDSLSAHAAGTEASFESDDQDDEEPLDDGQNDDIDVFSSHLDAAQVVDDHSFVRPRLPSHSISEASLSHLYVQQQQQQQQIHRVEQSQDHHAQPLQTVAASVASARSPASIGSSTSRTVASVGLVRSTSASQTRNRNRNNSGSNAGGGDTELPTWVSRAYREATAQQAQNGDHAHDSVHQDQQPSSTVATPDVVINTDGSPNRFKVLGGSSLQYLVKFTDVCLASYGFDATAPLFRHGLAQSDEFDMPLLPTLPNLPSQDIVARCIDIFFERIWPVFPALDRMAVQTDADLFLGLQCEVESTLQSRLQASRVPNLVILYAIVCIGLNETSPSDPILAPLMVKGTTYLTACYSLHAHVTAMPYQSSVQALLLLTLGLRACGKDGQSWYMLGLALRLAMSLGLHKSVETPQKQRLQMTSPASLPRRLWWSCFSLERLLQLECGRPSSIDSSQDYGSVNSNLGIRLPGFGLWQSEQQSDGGLATSSRNGSNGSDHVPRSHESSPTDDQLDDDDNGDHGTIRLFTAWVSLSAIMGQISDRFYNHRFGHAVELLGETARLTMCLTKWEAALPQNLKPQSTSHTADHPAAAFLAQQYYHAKMAVLRIAILFPHQNFQREVQKRAVELADIKQLLGAASQCVSAARSLVTLTLQLADSGIHSTLIGVQQTFLASIVLALSILRSPRSRLVRSDVELLTEATSYVESCYESWGYPSAFLAIFSRLRDRTTAISRGQALQIAPLSSLVPNGNAASHAQNRAGSTAHSRRASHVHTSQALAGETATPTRRDEDLLSEEQSRPPQQQTDAGPNQFHAEHLVTMSSLFPNSNAIDGGNPGSSMTPFANETGMEAFTSMEFEDFWDMLKADIFM